MNPYKITLPDFLLTDLYKESIVLLDEDSAIKKTPTAAEAPKKAENSTVISKDQPSPAALENKEHIGFLGSNKKHISIIVKDEQAIHLQDDLLDILSAILSACKLNLADVAIVNTHSQSITDSFLRNELSPKVTILFGVETTDIDLPFSIPLFKPQPFNNCTYLQSGSLEKMRGNSTEAKLEKSKLWVSLKNIFGI